MDKEEFKYILRYTVDPLHHVEEKLNSLIEFCITSRIDDVMFFIGCEELNNGHITNDEAEVWLDVISKAKDRLLEIGVTTSINPWATLLHADRGRKLKEDQKFNVMVDINGNHSNAQVCPLCEEWRQYITQLYALYASVNPDTIWVEDDFRLHNHSPLNWGGCFCEKHMEVFSKIVGKHLTREEFVKNMLAPGKPHPYRKVWLDVCRDTMVKLADLIGTAVHQVSPMTKVGLMSSNPTVHSAEGRDWKSILQGLADTTPMVNRIHLPAYNEDTPHNYLWNFNTISRLSRRFVPTDTEIYPELDNFPHTRFSKSHTFTMHQVESSLLLDSQGITLNLFDMMGNGVIKNELYDSLLKQSKDFLSAVKKLGLDTERQKGVKVLVNPLSSYTLHTTEGKGMQELYPAETFWAGLLSAYGISNTYLVNPDIRNEIVAVSGQYFRNLSTSEIEKLFKYNFVLLDGEAVFTLYDMGMGALAGIQEAEWHLQDTGFQSFEEICKDDKYCNMQAARLSCQNTAGDFLAITYEKGAEPISQVKNPYRVTIAQGMTVYENRVLILPYGRFNGRYQAHLNTVRQQVLQDILKNCGRTDNVAYIKNHPYLQLYYYHLDTMKVLVFVNSTCDAVKEITVCLPQTDIKEVVLLEKSNPEQKIIPVIRDNDDYRIPISMEAMEMKVVYWQK